MPDFPPCCFSENFDALDQQLYAAYNRGGDPATAGLNFKGDPCPTWFELPENVRAKWGAASTAARDFAFPMITVTARTDFGFALDALKRGERVRRAGWNGKGMWLALTEGSNRSPAGPEAKFNGAAALVVKHDDPSWVVIGAHIDMRAADGTLVIGWLASQTDMLATDWEIV